MNLQNIDRVLRISKSEFVPGYMKVQTLVVIENLFDDSPAATKWDFDYIQQWINQKITRQLKAQFQANNYFFTYPFPVLRQASRRVIY